MAKLAVQEDNRGVIFRTKIVPGSSSTVIAGLLDEMLKVRIAAPPEKGKANQCLLEFLARKLGVKKNAISIVAGQTSAVKHVQVLGISADILLRKLNLSEQGRS
jgi:hypothetical protein